MTQDEIRHDIAACVRDLIALEREYSGKQAEILKDVMDIQRRCPHWTRTLRTSIPTQHYICDHCGAETLPPER